MKKRGIVAVIVLLLIGLDQLVKSYIIQQIPLGEVRSWIPNFVSLTYLQNRGAAFFYLTRPAVAIRCYYSGCRGRCHLVFAQTHGRLNLDGDWLNLNHRWRSWKLY